MLVNVTIQRALIKGGEWFSKFYLKDRFHPLFFQNWCTAIWLIGAYKYASAKDQCWLEKSIHWWMVWGCTDSDVSVCLSASCRSNGNWDWPVKGVELHGQHGVCLQGRVRVIGRRPRLLSQLAAVNWSRHQALQDLLHVRENNPSGDLQDTRDWSCEEFNGLNNFWLFFSFLKGYFCFQCCL